MACAALPVISSLKQGRIACPCPLHFANSPVVVPACAGASASRSRLVGLGLHLCVAAALHRTVSRQHSLACKRLHILYSPGHGQENAARHGFCSISMVTELFTSNTGEKSNATHL